MASLDSPWDHTWHQRMIENITMLRLLDAEPADPAENELRPYLVDEPARQLSLEKERDLANHLAFLSASTHDPYRVTAVGIEEDTNGEGLTVRMAINKGDLKNEKRAFERIAVILQRIALQGRADSDLDQLLGEVIALDRRKILYHLRSKHAPWPRKPRPAVPELARAVEGLGKVSRRVYDLQGVKRLVVSMQEKFTKLEGMDKNRVEEHAGLALLQILVKKAYELASRDEFESLISAIPCSEEEARTRVQKTIQKLGRYYEVSLFLSAAAKRPVFRRVKVELLPLQFPHSRQPPGEDHQVSLLHTLRRILPQSSNNEKLLIQSLEVRSGQKFQSVEDDFRNMLKERHPIHAEIQLLYFYELYQVPLRPRVITSSKSACFLCNLFIKIHGKFQTPRTHGVLYHHWNLPGQETLALIPDQQRGEAERLMHHFNTHIENMVRSKIEAGKRARRHPNESVIFFAPMWSTSSLVPGPIASSEVRRSSGRVLETAQNSGIVTQSINQISQDRDTPQPEPRPSFTTQLLKASSAPQSPNCPTLELPRSSTISLLMDVQSRASPSSCISVVEPSTPPSAGNRKESSLERIEAPSTSPTPPCLCRKSQSTTYHGSYEAIADGETIERELSPSAPALRLSTKHIHITLTLEKILRLFDSKETFSPTDLRIPGHTYSVFVKVTYLSEQEDMGGDIPISIKDLRHDQASTVRSGAAYAPDELYLSCKTDTIRIKYTIRGLSSAGLG